MTVFLEDKDTLHSQCLASRQHGTDVVQRWKVDQARPCRFLGADSEWEGFGSLKGQ